MTKKGKTREIIYNCFPWITYPTCFYQFSPKHQAKIVYYHNLYFLKIRNEILLFDVRVTFYLHELIAFSLLIFNIQCKQRKEVMEMAGYKRSLLKTIRKRQLQFFGGINTADGLEKQYWVERFVVPNAKEDNTQNTQTVWIISQQEKNLPTMSTSGKLTTERVGRPWSPMSATDLAHDDDTMKVSGH